jgi:hypothetical protein
MIKEVKKKNPYTKRNVLAIRVDDEELEFIKKQAKDNKTTVAKYLRWVALNPGLFQL